MLPVRRQPGRDEEAAELVAVQPRGAGLEVLLRATVMSLERLDEAEQARHGNGQDRRQG